MRERDEEERQLGLQDVLGIVRRWWWLILVPTLVGPVASYLISLVLLKPVYSSQAFVLVEQQRVPDTFVPTLVTDQLEARLMTMQDQILSRSGLQPIIEEFKLYDGRGKGLPMDERVAHLRKDIKITPIRPENSPSLSGFYIEANAGDGVTAQKICKRVLSMFMEENLKVRSDRAESTTDFLSGQLQDAKRKLDDSDARLAAFKSRYMGRLPSDEQSNLQMLSSLSSRLDAINEALLQAQQQRAMQSSLLAQGTAPGEVSGGTRASLEAKIAELRVQLATLEARYTAEDPDVKKTKSQIETLQGQLDRSVTEGARPAERTASRSESTEVAQLRSSLAATDETIHLKKAEQVRLEQQIAGLQARIQLSPRVEEEYKGLTRDYESSLQFYNDMLTKKTQSAMMRDLEQKREGEQFRVMDPPSLPSKPSFPKREKFALGGLVMGFLFGSALASFLDTRQKLIRTEGDVADLLHIPILGSIREVGKENPRALRGGGDAAAEGISILSKSRDTTHV